MTKIAALERLGCARSDFDAAIFDFDGTLADSMWVWHDIDARFCEEYGLVLPPEYNESITGLGFEGTARYFIDELGLDMTVEQCCAEFNRFAAERYRNEVLLKPGALAFLTALKAAGMPIVIASSLITDLLYPALENNGAFELIDDFRLCDDYGTHKSEPLILELAAQAAGTDLERCILFEDIVPPIRNAKERGAFTVAVLDEDNEAQDTPAIAQIADLSIGDYVQLAELM